MIKSRDPRNLVIDLLPRSICTVQVAAVIADNWAIHSWGWNSVGSGCGEHAERAAIRRANRDRLQGSTIYVASRRNKSGRTVCSKPCTECQALIDKWGLKVIWLDKDERWIGCR